MVEVNFGHINPTHVISLRRIDELQAWDGTAHRRRRHLHPNGVGTAPCPRPTRPHRRFAADPQRRHDRRQPRHRQPRRRRPALSRRARCRRSSCGPAAAPAPSAGTSSSRGSSTHRSGPDEIITAAILPGSHPGPAGVRQDRDPQRHGDLDGVGLPLPRRETAPPGSRSVRSGPTPIRARRAEEMISAEADAHRGSARRVRPPRLRGGAARSPTIAAPRRTAATPPVCSPADCWRGAWPHENHDHHQRRRHPGRHPRPESLLNVLRDQLSLPGSKNACEQGECGSCSVVLDGDVVCSCLVMAADAHGSTVRTVEGYGDHEVLHPVQQALLDGGGVQCGFCTPGFVVAAAELFDANPSPIVDEIREALAGNVCRCTGLRGDPPRARGSRRPQPAAGLHDLHATRPSSAAVWGRHLCRPPGRDAEGAGQLRLLVRPQRPRHAVGGNAALPARPRPDHQARHRPGAAHPGSVRRAHLRRRARAQDVRHGRLRPAGAVRRYRPLLGRAGCDRRRREPEDAKRAAAAIVVEYEELEPLDRPRGRRSSTTRCSAAWRSAPGIRICAATSWSRASTRSAMQDQAPLGPESGLAIPDGEGGVDLYVATQWSPRGSPPDRRQPRASRPTRPGCTSPGSAGRSAPARTSASRSTCACWRSTPGAR